MQLVAFAALVTVARAGHLGYAAAPVVAYGSHEAVSTYSTHQQHAPAVHSYGAPLAYAAHSAPLAIAAHAAPVAYAAPVAKAVIAEPSAPAHYDFGYAVNDPHTGDSKSQHESRRGDVVQGMVLSMFWLSCFFTLYRMVLFPDHISFTTCTTLVGLG